MSTDLQHRVQHEYMLHNISLTDRTSPEVHAPLHPLLVLSSNSVRNNVFQEERVPGRACNRVRASERAARTHITRSRS
ncbi:hypothetical protein J6590_035709, partial [Homalodisca vitripennis]